ncbi:AfsR/SARP family transcriptional regulator [Ruania albidiflava]|uniref:AfsR/SARP family transcriptional regulator n=1 Tax=Ruania albidiflava TaxID=366586 RepID=UPI0023F03C7D|nr:BTAD domain-containing putative transcriptional regulator [Ruania albidiflava]
MKFRVLGPVALRAPDWVVPGPGLRSTLLAALLAARGGTVSVDALVQAMWGETAGEGARARLQVHVHRMRRLLGDEDALVREGAGYRLLLAAGDLDAEVFDGLADRALDRKNSPEEVAAAATEALALWHGAPFEGVTGDLVDVEAIRLADRRRAVLEAKFAARLQLGEHRELLDEVRSAAEAEPLHEGLQAQLMATLAAAGRRSDALAAYRATRERLVDELGIEPGRQLRTLHESILLGREARPDRPPRPHQLPPAPTALVGRREQLQLLDELVPSGASGGTVVLTGAPGIGKTALALTWAHARADRYPDGQLYVDLQGFGPGEPLPVEQVLTGFLRTFDAPADAHSWPLAEQTRLLRSLVHGRRLLVLLDNAASGEQVRPLLAASAGCAVLVTSRISLSAVTLHDGARPVEVPHLTEQQGRELLAGAVGCDADAQDLQPLVECCAGLPLALAIVGERARSAPGASPADLVAEIAATEDRLDRFDLGEGDGSLRSILTWSYQSLSAEAQLVFRSIGAFPGRHPDVGALAAISAMDHRSASRAVDELVRAHLATAADVALHQHDLLRDLAAELAQEHGPRLDEQAATRLVAYWAVRAAQARPRFVAEQASPMTAPELDRVDAPDFIDDERARRWARRHLPTMVAAARLVPEPPYPAFDRVLLVLSRMVMVIASAIGSQHVAAELSCAARQAAERSGDTLDVVRAALQHASAIDDDDTAVAALRTAIEAARKHSLPDQAAIGTGNLGFRTARMGDTASALVHSEEAVRLALSAGSELQANFWRCNAASQTLTLGDLAGAERYARQALAEGRRLGSDRELTAASAVCAEVALRRGDLETAESWTEQAAEHARARGLTFREADTEVLFGSIAAQRRNLETANGHFRRAVTLASSAQRADVVVEAYLAWAEALAAHGSPDARSCLAEAGAAAQRSMQRGPLLAVREKTADVERLLGAQAS